MQRLLLVFVPCLLSACATPSAASQATGNLPSVTGTWRTTWTGQNFTNIAVLTLTQTGTLVTGSYVTTNAPPGRVEGHMEGLELTGTWSEESGRYGGFVFRFSADGKTFEGTWGHSDGFDNGGAWSGDRGATETAPALRL
jgi:hypothetical protein